MRFEGNIAIPENFEEEELIVKGKKNKEVKLYSAYIYKVLLEESSINNTFKVKELCKRILERFKVYIEISTIQDYIKSINIMEDVKLQGDPYYGYYMENQNGDMYVPFDFILDDTEINILIQILKNSRIATVGAKRNIIEKLKYYGSENLNYILEKNKHIVRDDKHNHLKDLFAEDMIEVMAEQRPIMIQLKEPKGIKELKYIEFHTYAVLPYTDSYVLVGRVKDGKIARFIAFGTIKNYRVIENQKFTKVKVPIKLSTFFTSEGNLEILKNDHPNDFIFPTQQEIVTYKKQHSQVKPKELKEVK